MAFGYIGTAPTNDKTANNGVFNIKDINTLRAEENLASEGFDVDFLLQAGGGGAINGLGSGGGGAGQLGNPAAHTGGNGGKGVVILSMPDADYSGTTTGSPTVATGVSGKTVLTFNGSGSYTA